MPIAGTLFSAASGITGAINARKAKRERDSLLNTQMAEVDGELRGNYVDTAEAQSLLNQTRDDVQAQNRRNDAAAAMTGATHEAQLAAREQNNKTLTNAVRQVAAGANAWRNQLKNRKNNLVAARLGALNNEAKEYGNQTMSGLNAAMSNAATFADSLYNNKPAQKQKQTDDEEEE